MIEKSAFRERRTLDGNYVEGHGLLKVFCGTQYDIDCITLQVFEISFYYYCWEKKVHKK